MDYQLAKELKEAGFPGMDKQWRGGKWVFEEVEHLPDGNLRTGNALPCPTLEELIEACGEEFGCLNNNGSFWQANHATKSIEGIGKTPSEAVARLWLALNKKE